MERIDPCAVGALALVASLAACEHPAGADDPGGSGPRQIVRRLCRRPESCRLRRLADRARGLCGQ